MNLDRGTLLRTFLSDTGWGNAKSEILAGDASNRRYDRLEDPLLGRAVLMDAPPDKGEDIRPFIEIADHLRHIGLSAPKIIASDTESGFLILEDLGDGLYTHVVKQDAKLESELYRAATKVVFVTQQNPPPDDLNAFGPTEMADASLLAVDWYLKHMAPNALDIRDEFQQRVLAVLEQNLQGDLVLVQRDYHAGNLVWLPERDGVERVGLLDFQDAVLGHPAYDLASLLKDARRDVGCAVQGECIEHFIELTRTDPATFRAAFSACSAQRNLRILGIFTRLCIRDKKPDYSDFMPRVWRNLLDDFQDPSLQEFGQWIIGHFPEPTPNLLAKLKSENV